MGTDQTIPAVVPFGTHHTSGEYPKVIRLTSLCFSLILFCFLSWNWVSFCPLALALAKTDMWEGHAGQTQSTSIRMQNPFGFHYLSVTVLSGIPGYLVERDCYMRAARISDI